jgi:hypothetical protein
VRFCFLTHIELADKRRPCQDPADRKVLRATQVPMHSNRFVAAWLIVIKQ